MKAPGPSLVFFQTLLAALGAAATLALYYARCKRRLRQWHERKLRSSDVFGEINKFMKESDAMHKELSDNIFRVQKSVLRLTLFGQTTSRRTHEQQLEAGKEYLELGGNGPALAHYEMLYNDYLERSKNNDWNYMKNKEKVNEHLNF